MSPNRRMSRAENCRCERGASASRMPLLGAAAVGDASVVFTAVSRDSVADELGPFTWVEGRSDHEIVHSSPLLRKGMSQARAQCFAPGWIYAGEMFDFSWRRLAGPDFACGSGGDSAQ
jgi:hypothetical protein